MNLDLVTSSSSVYFKVYVLKLNHDDKSRKVWNVFVNKAVAYGFLDRGQRYILYQTLSKTEEPSRLTSARSNL